MGVWTDPEFYYSESLRKKEKKHRQRQPSYSSRYLPNGELTTIGKEWEEQQKREGKSGKK